MGNTLWDLGALHGTFQRYVLHEAVVSTGPDFTQLVAVHRPGARDRFLIGALRPLAFPEHLLDADDGPVPMAVAVDSDPVRAASQIQQRLLPRYEQAVWRLRVHALTVAAADLERVAEAWATVSGSFPGPNRGADAAAYNLGVAQRNAAGWEHLQTFLAHGPAVLQGIKDVATAADYIGGPISDDLQHMRGIDSTLERARVIRRAWADAADAMNTASPDQQEVYLERARRLRNTDLWPSATQLSYSGPALARAAEHLTDRIGIPSPGPAPRVEAALARSTANPRIGSASPAPVAPKAPQTVPRRSL